MKNNRDSMTEIEFNKKIDILFIKSEELRDELEKKYDHGFSIYEPVKALALLFNRMRRQIERKMRENGTT